MQQMLSFKGKDKEDWILKLKFGAATTTVRVHPRQLDVNSGANLIHGFIIGAIREGLLIGAFELGIPSRVLVHGRWFTVHCLADLVATGRRPIDDVITEMELIERGEKTDPRAKGLLPAWRLKNLRT